MIINEVSTTGRPITADYLDQKYLDIYNLRFNTISNIDGCYTLLDIEVLREVMESYSKELAMYLRANGVDVTKVSVTRYGLLNALVINLELYGKYHVTIRMLGLQREEPPITRYEVMPGKIYNVYSAVNIISSMEGALGYYDCSPCHYSNSDTYFCGMGLEMYTGKCTSKRLHTN